MTKRQLTRVQRQLGEFMSIFPLLVQTSPVGQFNVHFVGAWDEFETAILWSLRVHHHHDLHELHLTHVLIGWSVDVCDEAIGTGVFIVDLVFEQQHILYTGDGSVSRAHQGREIERVSKLTLPVSCLSSASIPSPQRRDWAPGW